MIRVVRLHFHSEYRQQFLELFQERKERIRHFPGCLHLELWEDQNHPAVFYTYSWWEDAAQLEAYRLSDLFGETWQLVKDWFSEKPMAFSANSLVTL